MVFGKNLTEQLVLGMVNCFDNESIVCREVEEAAALARRTQFRQDVFSGKRHLRSQRVQQTWAVRERSMKQFST